MEGDEIEIVDDDIEIADDDIQIADNDIEIESENLLEASDQRSQHDTGGNIMGKVSALYRRQSNNVTLESEEPIIEEQKLVAQPANTNKSSFDYSSRFLSKIDQEK